MSWARLDDSFPMHRKMRRCSDAAFRLHVSAICWSNAHLTDGLVHNDEIDLVSDVRRPEKVAAELVDRGLWERLPYGWRIHDYLTYNPSADDVRAKRAGVHGVRVAAGRAGGIASGEARRRSKREANGEANAKQVAGPLLGSFGSPVLSTCTSVDRTPSLNVTREDHEKPGVVPPDQRAEHVRAARSRAGFRVEAWTDAACQRAVDAVAVRASYDEAWEALAVVALWPDSGAPGRLAHRLEEALGEARRLRREAGNDAAGRRVVAQLRGEALPSPEVAARGGAAARDVFARRPRRPPDMGAMPAPVVIEEQEAG